MGSAINKLYIKRKINDIKFKIEKKKNKAILRDVLAWLQIEMPDRFLGGKADKTIGIYETPKILATKTDIYVGHLTKSFLFKLEWILASFTMFNI